MKIGRKMWDVTEYVASHPGCSKRQAGRAVTEREKWGYAIVDRAIDAGLIRPDRDGQGHYALYAVEACAWFAMCQRRATGTTHHPVLGDVPTCTEHHQFATGEDRGVPCSCMVPGRDRDCPTHGGPDA